jgi:predicted dehydrogenase
MNLQLGNLLMSLTFAGMATALAAGETTDAPAPVKLITLDPEHFHAALVQKSMYPEVSPVVHVYAPAGEDVQLHLKRIEGYNSRTNSPTHWEEKVYTGPDYLQRMIAERAGNVVVISGNNSRKAEYISDCINAGFNVFSDKPMVITPEGFELLKAAFKTAEKKKLLLYDIMPERFEITTILQRELARQPELFGRLVPGTIADPAVAQENVHYYFKSVSGNPLLRPPWFFDVKQQGEGIVDISTHLVDLVQWEAFPEKILHPSDVKILAAKRWKTTVTPEQFKRITGMDSYPDYLIPYRNAAGALEVPANGEFTYTLCGAVAKVSVTWNVDPPAGGGDTHHSVLRGSKADIIVLQGPAQNYKPTLIVRDKTGADEAQFEKALRAAVAKLLPEYPGLDVRKTDAGWEILVPDTYRDGHEAHFAHVAENYLKYLLHGNIPAWEVPNMLTKYHTTMEAFKQSR